MVFIPRPHMVLYRFRIVLDGFTRFSMVYSSFIQVFIRFFFIGFGLVLYRFQYGFFHGFI